jgi:glucosamine-6-phosphate deaminase
MDIQLFPDKRTLARCAAREAASLLSSAIETRGHARIVAATGTSQIEFLDELTRGGRVDWRRVELFHLDEYIGLSIDHPASFRRYLVDRLIGPAGILHHHLLNGEREPSSVCEEVGKAIREAPIDVAFVGIGENGHLAFNDPPADFEATVPYFVVKLDRACRQQQVNEGWFATLEQVPETAISMSVRQILDADAILCVVPEARKAEAVRASVEGPITPEVPASILRTHANVRLYLDSDSSSLLRDNLQKSAPHPRAGLR